jgi:hypothetical protein
MPADLNLSFTTIFGSVGYPPEIPIHADNSTSPTYFPCGDIDVGTDMFEPALLNPKDGTPSWTILVPML